MRLWSLHPRYLDQKGLGGLWFEGLRAQSCLIDPTSGYAKHSALDRFKSTHDPIRSICAYLWEVAFEGDSRGYNYNTAQLVYPADESIKIPVTVGQVMLEFHHLLKKLDNRGDQEKIALLIKDTAAHAGFLNTTHLILHPIFEPIEGSVEPRERETMGV